MNIKLTSLVAGIILTFTSFYTFAASNQQLGTAIQNAQAAAKAKSAIETVAKAQTAKVYAEEARAHIEAAIKNLEDAIKHGQEGHAEVAKGSALEALKHLNAAR
ncbi:hypothetical conserved protein [Candidatus Nitrosoglobus terrae]|uniref:Hypothetical conserved protein n=1 Tax=Candidatus Nitrosoglobus terrae TaxID=1630141 RepID=A0A1Q2SL97_9GAMM|nr:small metal-binding protein SmbP [Candidatus Nitrosoglobus terrae]BAW79877.1 hypothetical conserved protein [Candidatus Nitrosoglobus terrae]